MCWNCEEYVDPYTHLCYMKPIVNEDDEWQGECNKKQKPRQKRKRLSELKKGYFPHFFNRKENQTYVGPLPHVEHYDPDNMSKKERQEFLTWYNQLKNEDFLFDFEKEIEEYCRSDVDILSRCCLKFKELMEKTCGLDPFKYCVTITSACNRVFRQQFLREETIGLIPPQGYQTARKYSVMTLKWLSWVYHQTGNRILHAVMEVGNESMATLLMVMIPRGRPFTNLWVAFGMVVISATCPTR